MAPSPLAVRVGTNQPLSAGRAQAAVSCSWPAQLTGIGSPASAWVKANSRVCAGAWSRVPELWPQGASVLPTSSWKVALTVAEKPKWIWIENRPRLIETVSSTSTEATAEITIGW